MESVAGLRHRAWIRSVPAAAMVVLTWAAPSDATDLKDAVAAVVAEHAASIVELRHHLHQHPELSNREEKTAALVARHLEALGYDVTTGVAHHGVVGLLRGGRSGPVVAARADMDALPVTEQTGFSFASTVRAQHQGQEVGVAHACGHDIHTSVLLGVATVLASLRERVAGTIKLIFQPAEEGVPVGETGGAELMVTEGVLRDPQPEAIFALHSWPELEVGQLGYSRGPAMASVDQFIIKIQGQQSHGAAPHLGADPIVMASQVVLGLQTIRSRNLSPLEPSVVTVGIVRGGERFNIIPDEVHLEGTVRTYDAEVRQTVKTRMEAIVQGITQAGGGDYKLNYWNNTPETLNDLALVDRSLPFLHEAVGAKNVRESPPSMAGEDFAFFANRIPGFYFRLGVLAPGTESGGLHTPDFRADDGAVSVGMLAMTHLLLGYLGQ